MKKLLIGAFLAGGSLCLLDSASAHGGTYRGPSDTVPPGGGGGGGGGGAPSSGGPAAPGPTGPSQPGTASPGAPVGAPSPAGAMTSGGGDTGPDLTLWQYWWGFNKEPFINLKAAIHSGSVQTGSDDFFLGLGEKEQARDNLAPSQLVIRSKIVPALKTALRNERQDDILDSCLIALAKIGDAEGEDGSEPMAEDIKKFLSHPSQQLSETAAVSLGILANDSPENIGILLGLFQDESNTLRSTYGVQITGTIPARTRAFAGYGLGLIGYQAGDETRGQINQALVKLLDGEGKQLGTRDIQVASVISMGLTPLPFDPAAAAPAIEDPKTGKGWPKPAQVASRQDQILFLMNYFEDTRTNNFLISAHVPMAVARLLSDVSGDHPLRALAAKRFMQDTKKLSDAAMEIKQSCVQALGVIGDCDDDPIDVDIRANLMQIGDELADTQAKRYALIALGQVCGRPGKGAGNPASGLEVKKDNPRSYLMTQLVKAQSGTRGWAALGLAILERSLDDAKQTSSADAKRALRESLRESRTPDEVGAYAIAVGITRDTAANEILREKLDSTSQDEARGYCAVGLGLLNDRLAIEPIQEIIAKSKYKPDLLKSAAIGLGLLGDKKIVDHLIAMLAEATGLSSQAAIASALGFIGDARSVDPLIAMLQDGQKTALARGFAAAALGIVADKEDLPWNTKIAVNINYRANTTTLTAPEQGTGILDLL